MAGSAISTIRSDGRNLRSLILRGCRLREAARYLQARSVLSSALAMAERDFGSDSMELAGVLNQIGMLGKYAGWFDEAEFAYRRALRIVAWSCSPLAADLYHNVGGLAHARRNFAVGEPFARHAVAIRKRLYGSEHPDTAADMAALAALIDGQGRYVEAEPLYRYALTVFERHERYSDIAAATNNLAVLCHVTGRADEAEELYLRCLLLNEKMLGKDHPAVASSINNLAVFRRSQGKLSEAAELYSRAFRIFKNTLHPTHPKLVACGKNYENLLRELQENERSVNKGKPDRDDRVPIRECDCIP